MPAAPAVPMLSFPGCRFAAPSSSGSVFTPSPGLATSASGTRATTLIRLTSSGTL